MRRALLIVLLAAPAVTLPAQEEPLGLKVVVNARNPIRELPRQEVSNMFLYKVKRWENGGSEVEGLLVEPVDQPEDSELWQQFSRSVHRKRPSLTKRFWQKKIFSGKGRPPPNRDGDAAVLAFVASRVGAIGYVSLDAELPSSVRELRVDHEKK